MSEVGGTEQVTTPGPGSGTSRGSRLGLPATGRGSLAPTGLRLAAFAVDAIASALIAGLFMQLRTSRDVTDRLPGSWSLIPFAVDYVVGILIAGRTLGMYLFGMRVIRVDADTAVDPLRAALRTCLLMLLVPALVWDRDGRGLHDRVARTAVVRA